MVQSSSCWLSVDFLTSSSAWSFLSLWPPHCIPLFSLGSYSKATHCRLSEQLHRRLVSHLYVTMGTVLLVTPLSFTPPTPPQTEKRVADRTGCVHLLRVASLPAESWECRCTVQTVRTRSCFMSLHWSERAVWVFLLSSLECCYLTKWDRKRLGGEAEVLKLPFF